jgi:DNA-binding HxlR family transcriptional regulator
MIGRTYGDRCGIARALDVVGERWALLVVRELLLGPKRFTDLRSGLPHLSPDVLSQRLRELEQAGLVSRRTLAPPAGSRVYELTDRGQQLEPVLLTLGRWGSRVPFPQNAEQLTPDAFVLALKTLFEAAAADGLEDTYLLRIGQDSFALRVVDGRLDVSRDGHVDPDATIESDTGSLAAVLWHRKPISEANVRIEGDPVAVERFMKLFGPSLGGD